VAFRLGLGGFGDDLGMARDFRPVDRDTPMLLPPDLREWLPESHLVWLVIDVVRSCDLSGIEAAFQRGGVGRQAYDPEMLTTLLVYGYCQGVRSSRAIERACVTDVAFRVVVAQQRPDHSTIARFRKVHAEALAGLLGQVLMVCARQGMGRVGVVAVDGSPIAGDASPRRSYRGPRLRRLAAEIVAEAGEVDAAEDAEFGEARGDEIADGLASGAGRPARIREALRQLEEEEQRRAAADRRAAEAVLDRARRGEASARRRAAEHLPRPGEPASRMGRPRVPIDDQVEVRQARGRVEAAEAVLAQTDRGDQKPTEPTEQTEQTEQGEQPQQGEQGDQGDQTEQGSAGPGGTAAGQKRRSEPRRNTTDPDSRLLATRGKGFLQGFNAQLVVTDDHLILATGITQSGDRDQFVPMMERAVRNADIFLGGAEIGLMLADAGYCSQHALTAPGPDRLIATGRDPGKPGKSEPIAQMAARLAEGSPDRDRYKRRAATVEPVIGQLKDRIGLRRFSRRGLAAARHELAFAAAAFNICRLATL
jgi:transposase